MVEAKWNGELIAASDACVVVEGNQYFPPDAVKKENLGPSDTTTFCPWKGQEHRAGLLLGFGFDVPPCDAADSGTP